MKIIHSSDWHLGAQLHDQSRHPEQVKFLEWLRKLVEEEKPDALVVAGDIFDAYLPPTPAQELYFSFLGEIVRGKLCRNIVIVAGNHDSASFLDSPDKILAQLGVKVVGAANPEKEAVMLYDANGNPGLAIGAAPYLRDADIRIGGAGENYAEFAEKLREGLRKHYEYLVSNLKKLSLQKVPLVLTGHLFLSHARISDETSERARTIGTLGEVPLGLLPSADYYAFGHLHSPQAIGGNEFCRYSGAPIPMSFAEADQEKSVVVVEFGSSNSVRCVPIPCFQRLEQIKGNPPKIEARINELLQERANIWLDIKVDEYEGGLAEFWAKLPGIVENSSIKILSMHDERPKKLAGSRLSEDVSLDTIRPVDVFNMRMEAEGLSAEEKTEFSAIFEEIVKSLGDEETQSGRGYQ